MIAPDCDINTFINHIKDKHYQEIIILADREATSAERNFIRKRKLPDSVNCGIEYARLIKCLIFYMRYRIKPRGLNEETLLLFNKVPHH